MNFYSIVHNDFDGTASAAVYSRAVGSLPANIWFTEPTKIHNLIGKLELRGVNKIMIADIGLNEGTIDQVISALKSLISKGASVQWFDHHVWKEEWKKKLADIGVEVYHDTQTCGAGVVHNVMNPQDEFSSKLVSADCSVDIWLHNDPMGEKLRRIVENNREFSWKKKIIETFYNGILWNDEFQSILEKQVDAELKGYQKLWKYYRVLEINGKKVVVAIRWRGPPDISYAAQFLMTREKADVFVSANGKAISFRSAKIDVRRFAAKLGGGGHPLAAGASLNMPLIYRFLRRVGIVSPANKWVSNIVKNTISDLGYFEYKQKNISTS
ncbi:MULTISPECIES: DHH family phosphoesterase [Acidianus]|uniref:Phosphoesterase n=1 Tax=Candidatus Acidianus copahuensis TaxID=1160895 RepID=A0A031LRY8_9CREN|nr:MULTISPECIES: DHHA1 domain-containing protein [Acidianus]EZQ11122.1 phosphoesterase [Candidatus Acidianus copahuensis]NON62755.1 DHH family phosphoesterase [Acidianus sp. RZ1]